MFYAGSDNCVITEPYKISKREIFEIQHPTFCKTTKSGLIGGLAYALTKISKQEYINPIYTGLAASAGALLYYSYQKPSLINSLLYNSKRVLDHNTCMENVFQEKIQDEKIDEIEDIDESLKRFKEILQIYQKKSPIFLLSECVKEGWSDCILSRLYEPKYREYYESKVVSALLDALNGSQQQQQPIQYTSFGSGGQLQDIVILTKVLAQKPDAWLNINFIDLHYKSYIAYLDKAKNASRDMAHTFEDVATVMPDLILSVRCEGIWRLSDEEIQALFKKNCRLLEGRNQQIINFLRQTFPKARLSFTLHTDKDAYIEYIDAQKIPYPDVIAAVDIQDEASLLQDAQPEYIKLCIAALGKNPSSKNIFLYKNYTDQGSIAGIMNLSLEKYNDTDEPTVVEEDGKMYTFYEKPEEINVGIMRKARVFFLNIARELF